MYLYVNADRETAEAQLTARRRQLETGGQDLGRVPEPIVIIEILLAVIQHPKDAPDVISGRLAKAGKAISRVQVEAVFAHYALGEKKRR